MKKVTLREYAKLHKLSFFNVVKMVRNRELKSEVVKEEGNEVTYILLEEETQRAIPNNNPIEPTNTVNLTLQEENRLLKEEIVRLKEALEKCNKRTVLA